MKTHSIQAKILSVLLLLSICLASFSACGGGSGKTSDTTAGNGAGADNAAESTDSELKSDLPDVNYNGYEFRLLNGNTSTWMTIFKVTAEAETGDTLIDSIFRRNMNVEDKYGVKISEISTTSARSDVQKSILAADNAFDVSLMIMADSFATALAALSVEYDDIPYVDIDKPWWVQNSIEDLSINHRVYFAVSTFDTTHYDGARTLFFNKKLMSDFKLGDIYGMVDEGKWTIDAFGGMCSAVAADLNGDGKWNAGDRYGYTSYEGMNGQTFLAGIDAKASLSKDADDLPFFNLDNEEYHTKFAKLASVLNDTPGAKNPLGDAATHGDVDAFLSDYALFYIECLANCKHLRTMETDFGIIPPPKYDEAQEEYMSLAGNPYFMCVPITSTDLERTGVIMEALAYESIDTVAVAFYDVLLMGKVTRDNASEKMLDLIFNSLSFFHPLCLTSLHDKLIVMVDRNETDLASFFAANTEIIQKEINAAIETYKSKLA